MSDDGGVMRMTPGHHRWREFCERLGGPDGCDFTDAEDPQDVTWRCGGDFAAAERVLRAMGADDGGVAATTAWLEAHGAECDCTILLNVDTDDADSRRDGLALTWPPPRR